MNQYALVVDDTHMTEGVHALLNALIYYDMADKVDFHYLWWPGSTAQEALENNTYGFYPNFYPHRFDADLFPPEYKPLFQDCANACYHLRWAFCDQLREYEACSIFDADILLVNNVLPWFRVAAETGMLALPNNDFSGFEREAPHLDGIQGDASPVWHNQPCFFAPEIWGRFMADIPLKGLREHRSDIVTLTRKLIEEDRTDQVLTMSNVEWLSTHYYRQRLVRRNVADKRYLALHENGDRLNAVHRRWWIESICRQFITDITEGPDRDRGRENIRLFWDFYRFFNQECEHALDYPFVWPEV